MIGKKNMPMLILRNPSAIFACEFKKTQFTSAALANRSLVPLVYVNLSILDI